MQGPKQAGPLDQPEKVKPGAPLTSHMGCPLLAYPGPQPSSGSPESPLSSSGNSPPPHRLYLGLCQVQVADPRLQPALSRPLGFSRGWVSLLISPSSNTTHLLFWGPCMRPRQGQATGVYQGWQVAGRSEGGRGRRSAGAGELCTWLQWKPQVGAGVWAAQGSIAHASLEG